jgi:hypothetical protein
VTQAEDGGIAAWNPPVAAPFAFVRDVHSFFAFARGFDHGTVHVDGRLFEEFVRLTLPHVVPSFEKGVLQRIDLRCGCEPPTKVSRRCGIRNAWRAECVQIPFIAAFELDIFQTLSVRQSVVGDVENMIRFVIRKMKLQHFNTSTLRSMASMSPH